MGFAPETSESTAHPARLERTSTQIPLSGRTEQARARRKYGLQLDYQDMPDQYRKERTTEDGIQTDIYQLQLWSKHFPDLLSKDHFADRGITNRFDTHLNERSTLWQA